MKITPEQFKSLKTAAYKMKTAAYHDGKAQITDMRNRNFHRSLLEDAESEFLDALIDLGEDTEDVMEEVTV